MPRAGIFRRARPFIQCRHANALVKKSLVPKFPDFSASASGGSPRLAVQGTPGSICGPMRSPLMPSACTIAPEVSPPAIDQAPDAALDEPLGDFSQSGFDDAPSTFPTETFLYIPHALGRGAR